MDFYKRVGIETFSTKTNGIKGIIKQGPDDFIVQEIDLNGNVSSLAPDVIIPEGTGEYTYFTLVKKNWTQSTLLRKIASICGVSRKRFSAAGTKDDLATTSQRISAWRVKPETLSKVRLNDCKIGDFSFGSKKIGIGDLTGNQFTILVRDISINKKEAIEILDNLKLELSKIGGLPNFFGLQRFGMRLNNHLVGKELLKQNFENATKIYLTDTIEIENEDGKKARNFLLENWGDFKGALKVYPAYLRFERAVLNRLVKYPHDFVGAFKQLSKGTYKFFTHAYQSYIFNKVLSEKIKRGDHLSGFGNLVGYSSSLTKDELYLMELDGITQDDFKIKSFPEASVKGGVRPYLASIRVYSYKINPAGLKLVFSLEKGAYATIFLRELTKSNLY